MALSKITNASVADTAVHGRRNMVINGAMQVAQRGEQTGVGTGYGECDRFKTSVIGDARFTLSQSTDVPANQGFAYSAKVDVTTADSSLTTSDYVQFRTQLEAQNLQHLKWGTSQAEKLTLQFWVKSPKTGTHIVELYHYDATRQNSMTYNVTTANTWQKVVLTFDGYQTTGFGNDNDNGLQVAWFLAAGPNFSSGTLTENTWHNTMANRVVGQVNVVDSTSNNFYLTGVQLEVGEASPFEHRSFAEERLLCQRYYYTSWPYGTSTSTDLTTDYNNHGILMDTNDSKIVMGQAFLPVNMRAIPTVSVRSPSGVSGKYWNLHTDTDTNFSLTGNQVQPSDSAITLYEYDAASTTQRPAFVHIFCDAEL